MFKNMGFPGSSPPTGHGGPGAASHMPGSGAGGAGAQPGGGHPMVPNGMTMGGMGSPMGMGMMNGMGVPMGMGGMMGGAGANTLMMMGTSEDMYQVDEDLEGGDADGEHHHDVGGDVGMGVGVGLGDVDAMGVGMGVGGDADLHDAHHALAFGDHDGLGDAELADQEHDHDRAALLTGAYVGGAGDQLGWRT